MDVGGVIYGDMVHLVSSHEEVWFRLSDIALVTTPGAEGKSAGWPDYWAAVVSLKGKSDLVGLDADQWAQLKVALGAEG